MRDQGELFFIEAPEVARMLGLGRAGAFLRRRERLESQGFPVPVPWSARPLRWRREDVRNWIDGIAAVPAAALDALPPSGDAARRVVMLHQARQP